MPVDASRDFYLFSPNEQRGRCLKKNLNAPRPSEHPPVRGKKCQDVYVGSIAENTKPLHGI